MVADQEKTIVADTLQSYKRLNALEQIYYEARLSAHQRQHQQAVVQEHMVALQLQRGADPIRLAAVLAEQQARARLALAQNR